MSTRSASNKALSKLGGVALAEVDEAEARHATFLDRPAGARREEREIA